MLLRFELNVKQAYDFNTTQLDYLLFYFFLPEVADSHLPSCQVSVQESCENLYVLW